MAAGIPLGQCLVMINNVLDCLEIVHHELLHISYVRAVPPGVVVDMTYDESRPTDSLTSITNATRTTTHNTAHVHSYALCHVYSSTEDEHTLLPEPAVPPCHLAGF